MTKCVSSLGRTRDSLGEEVAQRFVDAGANFLLRYAAARTTDCFLHFRDGIARTSRQRRITPIQHRQIVMMVARREDRLAWNIR